jgi:alkylglycerol monooxygenase
VLNTPSHHRVHHGVNPKYIDRNHAGALIVWDRLFGTFQEEEEEPVYGITVPLNTWDPVKANLQHWQMMYREVKQMRGVRDTLKYLFMPPGWKPAYAKDLHQSADPGKYKKYDTPVSDTVNHYVLFQYVFMLTAATFFLFNVSALSLKGQLLAVALIVMGIFNFSALFESKKYAWVFELGRVLVSAAAVVFYFRVSGMALMALVTLWLLVSVLWLIRIKKLNP